MEVHQIRYFLAVERERNFSRAAESCNITQPALTRAIQRLEEELRGQLFERRPGHVEPTELGRILLPKFEQAMAVIMEAKSLARALISERRQRVRLGLMCTLGTSRLTMMLSSLVETCPDVELHLTDGRAPAVVSQLLMDEIDVAIVGLPRYLAQLEAFPIYTESYSVMMARSHPFTGQEVVKLMDLDGQRYVERINCEFEAHFEDLYGTLPINVDVRYRSAREDCVQALVAAGLGVAVVPQSLDIRSDLELRPLVEPSMYRTVSVVTVKDREYPPAVAILKKLLSSLGSFVAPQTPRN